MLLPESASFCISSRPQETSDFDILDTEDIIIEESPGERITIMIHGTNVALMAAEQYAPSWCVDALTSWLDSSRGLKPAFSSNHVYEPLAQALHDKAPYQFPKEHFYCFNWSGKLAALDRQQAAHDLYIALHRLCQEPRYKNASITLIGYSHGGNVGVNLAWVAEQKKKQLPPGVTILDAWIPGAAETDSSHQVRIDRLILLGCPVQELTQKFVSSSIFKHVYHLYTHADLVQIIDTQSPLNDEETTSWYSSFAFSKRTFSPDTSPNLVQAKVTHNHRSLYHKDFVTVNFFRELPRILCELENALLRENLPCTREGIYHVNIATKVKKRRKKQKTYKNHYSHHEFHKNTEHTVAKVNP